MIADRFKNMITLRRDSTAKSDLISWSRPKRLGSLWLLVAIGIGLTWLSFTRAKNTEKALVRTEFESASERVIAELVGSLELNDSFLRSLSDRFLTHRSR